MEKDQLQGDLETTRNLSEGRNQSGGTDPEAPGTSHIKYDMKSGGWVRL